MLGVTRAMCQALPPLSWGSQNSKGTYSHGTSGFLGTAGYLLLTYEAVLFTSASEVLCPLKEAVVAMHSRLRVLPRLLIAWARYESLIPREPLKDNTPDLFHPGEVFQVRIPCYLCHPVTCGGFLLCCIPWLRCEMPSLWSN